MGAVWFVKERAHETPDGEAVARNMQIGNRPDEGGGRKRRKKRWIRYNENKCPPEEGWRAKGLTRDSGSLEK